MRRSALAFSMLVFGVAAAPMERDDGTSGLPVPRFVSMKKEKVYARTGPDGKYPVAVVYVRKSLPVEVIKEYSIWRQVRDLDGGTGWVNKTMLAGERTAIVTRTIRTLYSAADVSAPPVWRIAPGAVVSLVLCEGAWCRVTKDGKGGYMLRAQLWGTYPGEAVAG